MCQGTKLNQLSWYNKRIWRDHYIVMHSIFHIVKSRATPFHLPFQIYNFWKLAQNVGNSNSVFICSYNGCHSSRHYELFILILQSCLSTSPDSDAFKWLHWLWKSALLGDQTEELSPGSWFKSKQTMCEIMADDRMTRFRVIVIVSVELHVMNLTKIF